ncbi:cobalamin (vitamin B12) biosynthesis CbiX protein [Crinalium epipsammum PCC 9333]|uniref:Cobalamin (Vitamin B12) biosynthesis CbiX protein n=1 Tax=Crinalium epipsammum PCC 9333 TaxID=1173022 RepID=K9W5P5_9CYAN|nr:sirohydrochlorin chelatase [Crinalium epipsammum]AFZ15104.1 cobalamin (vitamin B12) biosynthesis CbiX protein [Crinalium epipsammum PCC 9333]
METFIKLPLRSAYLLVSHGSRDPRPQAALEQLAELLKLRIEVSRGIQTATDTDLYQDQGQLSYQSPLLEGEQGGIASSYATLCATHSLRPMVGTACLELAALPLHEQIREFGSRILAAGFNRLEIVPLFLLPGVHVMADIPAEVKLAQQAVGADLTIELRPYLGSHPNINSLFAKQISSIWTEAWILLSHGSRRLGANHPVEKLAAQMSALPAYWSVSPSLEERVAELVNAGNRTIAILPYFLFAGGITDAIASNVAHLQAQFPTVQLSLGEPIGASSELADLILDLFE